MQAVTAMAASACLATGACKDPVGTRHEPQPAAAERGLLALRDAGCGACHEVPGLEWPAGRTGPSLEGFDDVGLIAGQLPNRPEVLAAFIRHPRAVKPDSGMPRQPITAREAADIASYLYGLDHD